jgi:hypothetical protein
MQFLLSPLSAEFINRPSPQDIGSIRGKRKNELQIYQLSKSITISKINK